MTLVLPNLQRKQMGQVLTTISVTNFIDLVMAERGFISAEEVRSVMLDNVIVDTGATLLSLPAPIISQLGFKTSRRKRCRNLGWYQKRSNFCRRSNYCRRERR